MKERYYLHYTQPAKPEPDTGAHSPEQRKRKSHSKHTYLHDHAKKDSLSGYLDDLEG